MLCKIIRAGQQIPKKLHLYKIQSQAKVVAYQDYLNYIKPTFNAPAHVTSSVTLETKKIIVLDVATTIEEKIISNRMFIYDKEKKKFLS